MHGAHSLTLTCRRTLQLAALAFCLSVFTTEAAYELLGCLLLISESYVVLSSLPQGV